MHRALVLWCLLHALTAAENPLWRLIDRHLQSNTPESFPDKRLAWRHFPEQPDLLLATLRIPLPKFEDAGLAEYSFSLYRREAGRWRLLLRYHPMNEKTAQADHPWFPIRDAASVPSSTGDALFALTMDTGRLSGVWGTLHLRVWLLAANSAKPIGAFDYPNYTDFDQSLTLTPATLRLDHHARSVAFDQRLAWKRTVSFALHNGALERVPPIAANPRDFIEELATELNYAWIDPAARDRGPILLQGYLNRYIDTVPCTGSQEWAVVFNHAVFRVQNIGEGQWLLMGATGKLPPGCRAR
ncbi:MAG: hypothetical protein HYX27_12230 [Acidobacteria bacterium]|nr:hypothetical protein [Acidobacteriota bacterium]